MVTLHKQGVVHAAFLDWKILLMDMKSRPTHVNELVGHDISYIGIMDISGIGDCGTWMSTTGDYSNIVWRIEWPSNILASVVSDKNHSGSIINSDLEMVAILLHWLVLEMITPTHHCSVLVCSNNSPACSWATHVSPKSEIAARLVRALALRQRIYQAAHMTMLHVTGKANDISDIPSQSFRDGHRWNCPKNLDFLTHFAL